jgi:uncharacterized phage protein (TIGR01671 family)
MIHNSGIDIAEHDGTDWNYLKELTFMQYTGLHDKNGVEIYEGDVCQDNYSDIYEILWSDHHQWACKLIKTDYTLSRGLTFPLWHYDNCKENGCRQLEVIGNIYENSELMKEEEH